MIQTNLEILLRPVHAPSMVSAFVESPRTKIGVELLDRYLPVWDVGERHELPVAAPAARAYEVLRALDLNRSRVVKALFWLRTVPGRVRGGAHAAGPPRQSLLDEALSAGWVILEEDPGRQLAVGAVTRPWEPVVRFQGLSGPKFRAFDESGNVKIAWGIAVYPVGPDASILATETRVLATDPVSRAKFGGYWFVFGSFIRLIRWIALRMARKELTRRIAHGPGVRVPG